MSKRRRNQEDETFPASEEFSEPLPGTATAGEEGAVEDIVEELPPEALPVELPQEGASVHAAMEAVIKDTWQPAENSLWINSRDFRTKDGAVPQGVTRTLEEAYALEVQRIG